MKIRPITFILQSHHIRYLRTDFANDKAVKTLENPCCLWKINMPDQIVAIPADYSAQFVMQWMFADLFVLEAER